jgi:hypothetical protein
MFNSTYPTNNTCTHEAEINLLKQTIETQSLMIFEKDNDFQIISNELKNEADRRGWCSDYEDFIESVNAQTKHYELQSLVREFQVTVDLTKTLTTTVTLYIEARSLESAEETVHECYDFNDLERHANDSDWDVDESDYSVVEVSE